MCICLPLCARRGCVCLYICALLHVLPHQRSPDCCWLERLRQLGAGVQTINGWASNFPLQLTPPTALVRTCTAAPVGVLIHRSTSHSVRVIDAACAAWCVCHHRNARRGEVCTPPPLGLQLARSCASHVWCSDVMFKSCTAWMIACAGKRALRVGDGEAHRNRGLHCRMRPKCSSCATRASPMPSSSQFASRSQPLQRRVASSQALNRWTCLKMNH